MTCKNVASIDIGTNTSRLLIAEIADNSRLKKLYREQKITRLGENLPLNGGIITPEAIERTIEVLKGFATACRNYNAELVRAVATSAVRSSVNGSQLIKMIGDETGIETEIISGEREAYLTIRGILGTLDERDVTTYILDIGGGSTEIAVAVKGNIKKVISFEVGVLNLHHEFISSEIPEDGELKVVDNRIRSTIFGELNKIRDEFGKLNPDLIATSGTPLTLACISKGLENYDTEKIEGNYLSAKQISDILEEVRYYTPPQRLQRFGAIREGREEILIPGSMILLNLLDILKLDSMRVTESSLLEGLMLEY